MGIYVSGPELVYAGSVIVACGASAYGALIASHARENKRRARQSWRRADKRWGEVHEEVLALEEIKDELAETRTDHALDPEVEEGHKGDTLHCEDPACWCWCSIKTEDEQIAEGYTAKVLAFGNLTPENGRTEARLTAVGVEVDDPWCEDMNCPFLGLPSVRHKESDHKRHDDLRCVNYYCPVVNEHLVNFAGCITRRNPDG